MAVAPGTRSHNVSLHKVEPIGVPSWMGMDSQGLSLPEELYKQLMIAGGEKNHFSMV